MKFFTFLLFMVTGFIAMGQELSEKEKEYNQRANECYRRIFNGDPTALDLIPDFLSDQTEFTWVRKNGSSKVTTLNFIALSIFYNECYFTGLPFDENIDKETFEKYINTHHKEIKYYSQFRRFTDLDADNISYPHRLIKTIPKPSKTLTELKKTIDVKRSNQAFTNMISLFWEIGELQTPEAESYLIECSKGEHWGMSECDSKEKVLSGIAFALGNFRTENALEALISLATDYDLYAMEDWAKAMARVTNRELIIENKTYDGVVEHYKSLFDELKSIDELKKSGYTRYIEYNELSEKDPLSIVKSINHEWWVFDNIYKDLLEEKDPLLLKVISSRTLNKLFVYNDKSEDSKYNFFEKYKWASLDFNASKMIEKLTGVVIELNYNGEWISESSDFEFNLALMNYWSQHYKDYKFKKKIQLFENTKEQVGEPNMLKLHFENMHTEDNALAMNAYLKLIEEDPEKVVRTMRNYNMDYIMGSLNDQLPMFTRKFLVQQCYLINYCKKNNIEYILPEKVKDLLEPLLHQNISFQEQLDIGDVLFDLTTIENITAIENFAITYGSRNQYITEIVGITLDKWYSQNINNIVNDSKQLRNYLYKSYLFDNLGIVGVVNNYDRKLYSLSPSELTNLKSIANNDSDEKIRKRALSIINNNLHYEEDIDDKKSNLLSFDDFLKVKDKIDDAGLNKVFIDTSNLDSLQRVFDSFARETNPEVILNFILLMDKNLHVDMVPHFIEYYDKTEELQNGYWGGTDLKGKRHRVNYAINTGDYMVYLTEKVYDYYNTPPLPDVFNNDFVSSSQSGPMFLWNKHKTKDYWSDKWQKSKGQYHNWGRELFTIRLTKLVEQDSISVNDLSKIIESKYWNEDKHSSYLNNILPKLTCEELINVKSNWNIPGYSFQHLISRCEIPDRKLEKVFEKFSDDNLSEVLNWLNNKVSKSNNQLIIGDEITSICWNTSFRDSLKTDKYNDHKTWVISTLKNYADSTENSFDKEYANSFRIELELSSLSIKDQLHQIEEIDDEGVENVIDQITQNMTYEELQTNWNQITKLMILFPNLRNEIRNQFGFFILEEDLDNIDYLENIINEGSHSEVCYILFSRFYDVKNENGDINHKQLFEFLKYGKTDGFVGSGNRDLEELHHCILKYSTLIWNKELKEFAKKEYPNLKFDHLIVVLNYMVNAGFIPSQEFVPVSFSDDNVLYIR